MSHQGGRGLLVPGKYNSRGERRQIDKHVHELVAKTAVSIGHEIYELLMKKNEWYDEWKRQNPGVSGKTLEERFVARTYGNLIEQARATLAHMLSLPSTDPSTKERIYESLLLDKTLTRGRVSPGELSGLKRGN